MYLVLYQRASETVRQLFVCYKRKYNITENVWFYGMQFYAPEMQFTSG